MPFQKTVLAILAVWRITHLLTEEDGPARVVARAAAAIYLEDAHAGPANLREEDADVLRPAVVDAHHPAT